jgi:hypothetical protein
VATLEFEKDRAVAAPADHPTRWRFWPEPESLQEILTTQELDSVFAIEHELRTCIAFEHRPRKWQLLKAYRRLPATGAMAFCADERRTIELDRNLCALARHNAVCQAASPWRLVWCPLKAQIKRRHRAAKPLPRHRLYGG